MTPPMSWMRARRAWHAACYTALACALTAGQARAGTPVDVSDASLGNTFGAVPGLRVGRAKTFRDLVPAETLEREAADEYRQVIAGAQARHALLPDADARVRRLRVVARRLIPASYKWSEAAKQWQWEVNVVRSTRIDAFCLPGGKIVFTSGMFDKLALTDAEAAMLLGHEIAHALREHARESLGREQAAQSGATGEMAPLLGLRDLGGGPPNLDTPMLTIKYSHDDETEADVIGTDIASRAGYDPRAAIRLWNKLLRRYRGRSLDFLASHPYAASRIQDLRKRMPDMLALYEKARDRQ